MISFFHKLFILFFITVLANPISAADKASIEVNVKVDAVTSSFSFAGGEPILLIVESGEIVSGVNGLPIQIGGEEGPVFDVPFEFNTFDSGADLVMFYSGAPLPEGLSIRILIEETVPDIGESVDVIIPNADDASGGVAILTLSNPSASIAGLCRFELVVAEPYAGGAVHQEIVIETMVMTQN